MTNKQGQGLHAVLCISQLGAQSQSESGKRSLYTPARTACTDVRQPATIYHAVKD